MATTRWWALWFVFNLFFLSWLFDWVKLGKDWASREKLKRQEVVRSSLWFSRSAAFFVGLEKSLRVGGNPPHPPFFFFFFFSSSFLSRSSAQDLDLDSKVRE